MEEAAVSPGTPGTVEGSFRPLDHVDRVIILDRLGGPDTQCELYRSGLAKDTVD